MRVHTLTIGWNHKMKIECTESKWGFYIQLEAETVEDSAFLLRMNDKSRKSSFRQSTHVCKDTISGAISTQKRVKERG